MVSLIKSAFNAIFRGPVLRDVDDDELPLPEHRREASVGATEALFENNDAASPSPRRGRRTEGANGRASSKGAAAAKGPLDATTASDDDEEDDKKKKSTPTKSVGRAASKSKSPARAAAGQKRGRSPSKGKAAAAATSRASGRARSKSTSKARAAAESEPEPDATWTVAQLKQHAAANDIDLAGCGRKTEMLDRILETD